MSNNAFPDPMNVNVVSPDPLPVSISSPIPLDVNVISPDPLPVDIVFPTNPVLTVPFLSQLSTPTLAIDTVVDGVNRDVTLTAGHGLTVADVGEVLELADSTNGSFFMQAAITNVVLDVITLDTPINRVYTTAASLVAVSTLDMNVDGSVTPVTFSVLPFNLQRGAMEGVSMEMRDNAPMDFETFGGLPALLNGVVVRVNNGDGTYRNLYNFKSNGDIIERALIHSFFLNNGGNTRGFSSNIVWGGDANNGTTIPLDGSAGQSLEVIVQDDLTGLARMHWSGDGKEN